MSKQGAKSSNAAESKGTKKPVKPTSVKSKAKGNKTVPKKPKQPAITEAQFKAYFMKMSKSRYLDYCEEWNEKRLKVNLKNQPNYDAWLNYFKTMSPRTIRLLAETGLDILPTEGYAALSRWHDIISNPARIDKIHRAGLTTGSTEKTIVQLAQKNDRLGVLKAIRDEIALKIQQGAGARDAGTLSAQLTEIMTQIDVQEARLGPKKATALGSLMADMPTGKRPSKNGGGTRNTRYAAKVTIDDLEE